MKRILLILPFIIFLTNCNDDDDTSNDLKTLNLRFDLGQSLELKLKAVSINYQYETTGYTVKIYGESLNSTLTD